MLQVLPPCPHVHEGRRVCVIENLVTLSKLGREESMFLDDMLVLSLYLQCKCKTKETVSRWVQVIDQSKLHCSYLCRNSWPEFLLIAKAASVEIHVTLFVTGKFVELLTSEVRRNFGKQTSTSRYPSSESSTAKVQRHAGPRHISYRLRIFQVWTNFKHSSTKSHGYRLFPFRNVVRD